MPEVADFVQFMETVAPMELAEEWDNPGLLVDAGKAVVGVLVALDITPATVAEAQEKECQLIVAHHPVIFHPLRRLAHEDPVYKLAQCGISALCAHTNLDAAAGGVNDVLAGLLGLRDTEAFAGLGRVGKLPGGEQPAALAALCADRLNTPVQYADAGRRVHTLAVLGGSGRGLVAQVAQAGADAVLTGEAGHHDALDALQLGVSLFVAGHFATEWPVVPVLADTLAGAFPGVRVQASATGADPFRYVGR